MISTNEKNYDIIKGEIDIIHEEFEKLDSQNFIIGLHFYDFLENIRRPLSSIENKIGTNSIEYITISTEIVDAILKRISVYTNDDSYNNIIRELTASETVKFYANQRKLLIEAYNVCDKIEFLNMDYAYRTRTFNPTKEYLRIKCKENGIDLRTSTQKKIDNFKAISTATSEIAKGAAGCAVEIVIKIVVVLLLFLIIMAIVGAK